MTHDGQLQSSEMGRKLLAALRKTCSRLPEVTETIDGFGHTTFKVRGKSFVIAGMGKDSADISIKADHDSQAALIRRGPWFRTPYIGQHGWVSMHAPLDHDEAEIEQIITDGYRLAAPRRLARMLPAE